MTQIEQELEEMTKASEWLAKNVTNLPLIYQLKYMNAIANFMSELKPIYVAALMYMGGDK